MNDSYLKYSVFKAVKGCIIVYQVCERSTICHRRYTKGYLFRHKGEGFVFGAEHPRLNFMSCPPGRRTLLKDLQFLITSYLQVLPWLFLFTVHTRHNTPHARFCVIVQFFSFHYLSAIFVGTSNNFELAGFQVSLLQAML